MKKKCWAHPTAIVETGLIGRGTRIWAFTHVMNDVSIGENCNIGEHCFIESGAVIGDNVTIKNENMIWRGVTLEDGVFVGPHATFTNDLYPRSARLPQVEGRYADLSWLMTTCVKQGASIGAGAVILPRVTIHEFAMVGAGAIVTRDAPPYALVFGSPARIQGWVCQCGRPLKFEGCNATCDLCQLRFSTDRDDVRLTGEVAGAGDTVSFGRARHSAGKSYGLRKGGSAAPS
jgi:acetyltransferase-like isoleucine patch superfamily enzyme